MELIDSVLNLKEESIFDMLKREHAQIIANLQQIIAYNKPNSDLLPQTIEAKATHIACEERLLYPFILKHADTRPIALSLIEEHNMTKQVFRDMLSGSANQEVLTAKVRVIRDLFVRHVEVEENEVFEKMSRFLSDEHALKLGRAHQNKIVAKG
jgi:hemerythrin-like domain-containing protein